METRDEDTVRKPTRKPSKSRKKTRKARPTSSATIGPTGALTQRQKEILHLVVLGLTNREVAAQLDISVRTVEVHRFNLMRRMNVRNVAQLLRHALALKLMPKNFSTK